MPRFYFDFDGRIDEEGMEFDEASEAREQLAALLPEVAKDAFLNVTGFKTWICVVRDERGHVLRRAALAMIVEDMPSQVSHRIELIVSPTHMSFQQL